MNLNLNNVMGTPKSDNSTHETCVFESFPGRHLPKSDRHWAEPKEVGLLELLVQFVVSHLLSSTPVSMPVILQSAINAVRCLISFSTASIILDLIFCNIACSEHISNALQLLLYTLLELVLQTGQ